MADIKDSINKNKGIENPGNVPIADIIFMTLHHWPWILLSVIICVGAAYIYLLRTPNVYTRSAEILIKEDKKGQSLGADEFAKLGLFQTKTNIQNELITLKAKDLMEEVVKRLGLDINYYIDGRFHNVVAYGENLPIKLTVLNYPDDVNFSMDLTVSKDGKIQLKNLREGDGEIIKGTFSGKLNDTIVTPIAKMLVSPSPYYLKGKEVSLIISKIPLKWARDTFNKRLAVTMAEEDGTVLSLGISDQSPQRADDILNTLIGVYNENWIRDKNQIAISTSNFINDRLGVIEGELGNVDSDISAYKSSNLIPDIEAAASLYMNKSQRTEAQILEVNNKLSVARYLRSYFTADGKHDQLLPANTGLENSNIQGMIVKYNETLLQRNSLVSKSSEQNPLVEQLDEQLRAQRQAVLNSIDNEIVSLNTELKSLRSSEAQTMSQLASNPMQAKNLLTTERQQKVKEALYLFLLQKREENELTQAFTAYNTRIVNKPGAANVPPTPNRTKILGIAFLIGLAIPFGVTYAKETSNTKIRGRKDIENLQVPFLGEIPLFSSEKVAHDAKTRTIVVKAGNRDIINEAFRVLRTNVQFMSNATQGCTVIAVTSFNPGSGKSFVTVNLGMTMSLKGKKVLIIDGDMRHGSASVYVRSPKKGLSDYLSGVDNNIDSLIVKFEGSESLSFLPVGSIPPNPTELLESSRFAQMINEVKGRFDYVLIDCPPIEIVADAQIIDSYADRTFFIVRAGLLERSMLPDLDRLYEEKKYKNMGIILNGTSTEHGRYGKYGHSYRYGYGYGYGHNYYGGYYTSDGTKKRKKGKNRSKSKSIEDSHDTRNQENS